MNDFEMSLRLAVVEVADAASAVRTARYEVAECESILAGKKDDLFRIVDQERKRLIASADQPDMAAKQEEGQ